MLKHTISPLTYKKREKREKRKRKQTLCGKQHLSALCFKICNSHTHTRGKNSDTKHLDVLGKWNYDSK